MAYDLVEPFGAYRADVRSAIVAQVIANVNRGKGQSAYKVDDFMPKFQVPGGEEAQPWQAQLQYLEAYTAALGGEDLRRGNTGDTDDNI